MLALFLNVIGSQENRTLFEYVYYEYRGLMHGIAMGILHDYHLAEDAVSEAFWRIARNFDRLTAGFQDRIGKKDLIKEDVICPQMKGYAVIVVKNVCLSMQKKDKHIEILFMDDEAEIDVLGKISERYEQSETQHIRGELRQEIEKAVGDLNETLRHTMFLYVVMGQSISEIADVLDCDYETIKKRIQRGRKILRGKVRP